MNRSIILASFFVFASPGYMLAACSSSSPSSGRPDTGSDATEDSAVMGDAPGEFFVDAPTSRDALADSIATDAAGGRDVAIADVLDSGADSSTDHASSDAVVEAAPYVDPFGGAYGCPDGGFMAGSPACFLNMPVSGGVSTVAGNYCRNSASTSYIWYASNGINPDVQINFSPPIVRGMIGPQSGVSVSILYQPTSGTWITWTTPPGVCTATLDSNVCWLYQGSTYYLISGRGSCSAPATPQPDAAAPVTIGDFSFAYSIYP